MDPRIHACRGTGDNDTGLGIARHDDQPDLQQNPVCIPRCSNASKNQHDFIGGGGGDICCRVPICWILGDTNRHRNQRIFKELLVGTCMSAARADKDTCPDHMGRCGILCAGDTDGGRVVVCPNNKYLDDVWCDWGVRHNLSADCIFD